MGKLFLFSLYLLLVSCGPDDPVGTCSLDSFDGKYYLGSIRLCNAMPGQQEDFAGRALITVSDSLLTFAIESTDPNHSFTHVVSVLDDCIEPEKNNFIHVLSNPLDNSVVGEIGEKGTSLFLDLVIDPCADSSVFSGFIEN